jgi:regulator of replication initiation timing
VAQHAMLDRRDAGIVLFQEEFKVCSGHFGNDGAQSPDLVRHYDGFG